MVNPDEWAHMTAFEKELLRNTSAIALWSLLTFVAVAIAPVLLVVLSMMGF